MIRLAVVGCVGTAQQYVDVAARVQHASFVATVDTDLELARSTAARLGAAVSAANLPELLERHAADFDAVLIHSENCVHSFDASLAVKAQKHLLVETPFAFSTSGAEEVVAAAERGKVCLMVGQSERFQPSIQVVRDKIAGGQVGEPALVRIHRWEGRCTGGWQAWQQDVERSGGTILSRVTRDIDLVCWLFGRQPTEVFAVGRNPGNATDEDWDYVQLHLGFTAGAMALIVYSRTLPAGDGYFSLSAIGSTGAVYADDHHNMQLLYRGGAPLALKTGQGHHQLVAQLQEFVNAIEEDRTPSITGTDGKNAVNVARAAQKSIATGLAVHLAKQEEAL